MTMTMKRLAIVLVAALLVPVCAIAADLTDVNEIVAKANHAAYYKGQDGKARVSMVIKDAQGRERTREFTILRLDGEPDNAEQKFYVYFHRPADVREMAFIVHKHVGRDDDRWMYLPSIDVVKRIAASDERTSFVGSHFFYEDVSGRGVEEDSHELTETTDNYYVIKNTPKKPEAVEFDSYKMYVHKASFIPVKIEFEKGGKVYRVAEVLGVEEIQGHKTVTKARVKDDNMGGETVVEYKDVAYDVGIPDEIFSERYLRKAPRQFIR